MIRPSIRPVNVPLAMFEILDEDVPIIRPITAFELSEDCGGSYRAVAEAGPESIRCVDPRPDRRGRNHR